MPETGGRGCGELLNGYEFHSVNADEKSSGDACGDDCKKKKNVNATLKNG